MPFYLHAKAAPLPTSDPGALMFTTREEAIAAQVASGSRTLAITFVCTAAELDRWYEREAQRFNDGTYMPVPWRHDTYTWPSANAAWNTNESSLYHAAHLSLNDPGMIAYTPNDDYGMRDRHVRLTPGKYLAKFGPPLKCNCRKAGPLNYRGEATHLDWCMLSVNERWIAACSADRYLLKIATTPDDIEKVYTRGPQSCMRAQDHSFASDQHPVRAYGNSDLAVAYYGDINNVSGRAVVWPARMLHSRIYGATETMKRLLTLAGYTQGNINGARIHALRSRGAWIMPYVDWHEGAQLVQNSTNLLNGESRYFVIHCNHSRTACYDTQNQNGLTDASIGALTTCRDCGDEYDPDEGGGDGYCDTCYDRVTCAGCDNRFDSDEITNANNGESYCDDCYGDLLRTCTLCECEWREEDLDYSQRESRRSHISAYGVTNVGRSSLRSAMRSYCLYCYTSLRFCDTHSHSYLMPDDDAITSAMLCDCGRVLPVAPAILSSFAELQLTGGPIVYVAHRDGFSDSTSHFEWERAAQCIYIVTRDGTRRMWDSYCTDIHSQFRSQFASGEYVIVPTNPRTESVGR